MPIGARILVVDDNDVTQELLKAQLDEAGYDVIQALTAADAASVLARGPLPDVIVLEVALPDADGRDLLATLKRDRETADVPVVVWSGHEGDSGPASGLIAKIERLLLSRTPLPTPGNDQGPQQPRRRADRASRWST